MRRFTVILLSCLALFALWTPCLAAPPSQALTQQMEQFRADNGLNEQNFSICYYNTVTGEEYRWNDTRFMTAGSTFKLPLNLYYYELEWDGKITPETTIGGVSLADCRRQTLVWSDNDLAIAMLYRIGSFRTYKTQMLRYFTLPAEQITSAYYADNNYCTAMMLDALKYLYERSNEFSEMLDYMKQAQPENYFRLYVTDTEIAHKYGFFEGAVNDVGIVYTPQPFLLAVYTQDVGEQVVGKACQLLRDYTVAQDQPPQPAATPQPPPEPPQTQPDVPQLPTPLPDKSPSAAVATPQPDDSLPLPSQPDNSQPDAPPTDASQTVRDNMWWMILIAASIFLVGDLAVLLVMKHRTPEDYGKRYEKKRKRK